MNWKILGFGLLLLPLLIGMGIWQWQRAVEKEAYLSRFNELLQAPAGDWQTLQAQPLQYQRIQLTGFYLSGNDWLVDNQVNQGQFGYRVYTPFCHSQNCILVDRGWVKGDLNRAILPVLNKPEGTLTILGRLDKLSKNPVIGDSGPLSIPPYRVQQLTIDSVRKFLRATPPESAADRHTDDAPMNISLSSWVVRLNDGQPGHFIVTWKPVVIGPAKHYGYAFQWFAMAVALIILMLYLKIKQR